MLSVRSCARSWGSRSPLDRMCCATHLPHTCRTRAAICAASSFCSATAIWRPPRNTCTFPKPGCTPYRARLTIYRSALTHGSSREQNRIMGHRLEVPDVFHAHQNQFLKRWGHKYPTSNARCFVTSADAERLRSAVISNDTNRCNYETVAYDSCRNRHCPKCQLSRAE